MRFEVRFHHDTDALEYVETVTGVLPRRESRRLARNTRLSGQQKSKKHNGHTSLHNVLGQQPRAHDLAHSAKHWTDGAVGDCNVSTSPDAAPAAARTPG